ncbi:hypothetical protein Fmac_004741 [Flemingia macrophylla]|uniref:Uncharacterized protein n=1 Tax=Flemingia macrophylla TaxID=520843 RepID=A0ABD1N6E6_9FABA
MVEDINLNVPFSKDSNEGASLSSSLINSFSLMPNKSQPSNSKSTALILPPLPKTASYENTPLPSRIEVFHESLVNVTQPSLFNTASTSTNASSLDTSACLCRSVMNVPADEPQFMSILLKVMNAKKTIQLGFFTGYSLLSTTLALLLDGKAGMEQKIDFIQAYALSALRDLLKTIDDPYKYDKGHLVSVGVGLVKGKCGPRSK